MLRSARISGFWFLVLTPGNYRIRPRTHPHTIPAKYVA